MDYEFRRDVTGQIHAQFSMGHEAIGYWLNEEVKGDTAVIETIKNAAQTVIGSEKEWVLPGKEYTLSLDEQEVMVRANQLEFSNDEMEEGFQYYDEESLSFCGLTDFLSMLDRYHEFLKESA